jgi:4-hydroxy-4-methyl-2-oxoglutarate aldolase
MLPMKRLRKWTPAILSVTIGAFSLPGQWVLTKDQMIAYTAKNPYDRFPDGRPKVPDNILEKVKGLVIEEAWGAVRSGCTSGGGRGGAGNAAGAGGPGCYPNQFAGDWKILNPGKKLVGRAFTVQFMPLRPDVAGAMQEEADKKGLGRLRNQTVIDMLQPGDVIVVDLFGKIDGGTFVGDKLLEDHRHRDGCGRRNVLAGKNHSHRDAGLLPWNRSECTQ